MGFKESKDLKDTGVYLIRNTVNKKLYVGSASISFRRRWTGHISSLRKGTHRSRYLQRAFIKHGEDSFEFRIILKCLPGDCIKHEQFFINHFRSATRSVGYNISPTAGSARGVKHSAKTRQLASKRLIGHAVSEETRSKIRDSLTGMKASLVTRAKMSKSRKGKNRDSKSAEHKSKISKALTGRTLSAQHRERISSALRRRDYPSAETRTKIAKSKLGKKRPKFSQEWRANIGRYRIGKRLSETTISKIIATRIARGLPVKQSSIQKMHSTNSSDVLS